MHQISQPLVTAAHRTRRNDRRAVSGSGPGRPAPSPHGEKAGYLEDAVVKTIAGFANSFYGGTLLVGVTDGGGIYGLKDDYATFSKRGDRGDRDLWGQHLKNLLDRLGKSAAALVEWDFFTIDGKDICRVSIDPSDHPVFEKKSDAETFWWRTPVSTDKIDNDQDRDRVIARRWQA